MKRKFIVFFIVVTLIILSVYLFLRIYEHCSRQEQVISAYTLSSEEAALLRDGDIILRRGYGFVSDMIVKSLNDNTGLSHCAILTQFKGHWIVVHSISSTLSDVDGVQWQDLRTFIKQSKKKSVVVMRYRYGINGADLARIGDRAKYYLEKKIPFDNAFDLFDSSSFYCSELLWKVFKDEYHVDIFKSKYCPGHYDYMKFDNFLDTSNFKVIIDHRKKTQKHF